MASGTEPQDLRHFVGDATGSMPVCYGNLFGKAPASGTEPQDLRHLVGDATGSMPVCLSRREGRNSAPGFSFSGENVFPAAKERFFDLKTEQKRKNFKKYLQNERGSPIMCSLRMQGNRRRGDKESGFSGSGLRGCTGEFAG